MKKIFLGLLFILLSQSVHARYFDPEGGRFINRDPLQYIDGMNLYAGYFAQRFKLDPMGTQDITPPQVGSSGGVVSSAYRGGYPQLRHAYEQKGFGDLLGTLFFQDSQNTNGGAFDYFFHTTFYKINYKKDIPWEYNILNPNAKGIETSHTLSVGFGFFAYCTGEGEFKNLNMSMGFLDRINLGQIQDLEHEVFHLDYNFPTLIDPLKETAELFNSRVNIKRKSFFRKTFPVDAFGYNQYSIDFNTCKCEEAAKELNEKIPKAYKSSLKMSEDHKHWAKYFGVGNL